MNTKRKEIVMLGTQLNWISPNRHLGYEKHMKSEINKLRTKSIKKK